MIPIAAELLKAFQSDSTFIQTLFKILIEQVEQLPNQIISFNGYEALIGMLKWALPMDTEKICDVAVETLCKKVLPKIASGQTQD